MPVTQYKTMLAFDEMSDKTFEHFSTFVQEELGINMSISKKVMLQVRLQKRLKKLGINTFEKYHEYVFSPQGMEHELPRMVDVVTTHKTSFFREPQQFEYLAQHALPTLLSINGARLRRPLKIWSAGCSNGMEPYTIAMVLSEFIEEYPGFQYRILATDISTGVLEQGIRGIYDHEHVEPVSMKLRKKYLLRSKDKSQNRVRIIPKLRSRVTFRQLNLMDEDLGVQEMMDIIFCRNVIIYFDRATQEEVLNKLYRHLNPGGYLFVGPSEALSGMNIPLLPVSRAVYQKPYISNN